MLYYLGLCKYTFAQRRNRLTTHFPERISVVQLRISVDLKEMRMVISVPDYEDERFLENCHSFISLIPVMKWRHNNDKIRVSRDSLLCVLTAMLQVSIDSLIASYLFIYFLVLIGLWPKCSTGSLFCPTATVFHFPQLLRRASVGIWLSGINETIGNENR
jgi:hypothetical protein